MPKYLWKGLAPDGQLKSESIEATTARESRLLLENQGWTKISLLHDEISFYSRQQVNDASKPSFRVEEPPDVEARRAEGKLGFFWEAWRILRKSAGSSLLLLALLAWGIYKEKTVLIVRVHSKFVRN